MVEVTPKQIDSIHIRITATCNAIRIEKQAPTRRAVEVTYFAGARHIETVRIEPGGAVTVIS